MGSHRPALAWLIAAMVTRGLGVVALARGLRLLGEHSGPRWWLLVGLALLLVAGGLQRAMASAGLLSMGLALAATIGATTALHLRMAAAVLVVAGSFAVARQAVVWPSRRRIALAARVGAAGLVGVAVVGVATARLTRGLSTDGSLRSLAHHGVELVLGRDDGIGGASRLGHALERGLPVVAGLVALAVLWLLVQAEPDPPESDGATRNRVDALCSSVDGDAMAPFTRRQDKNYVFSPDGRAVIGYRVVFGVCVTGPGPVGAPDAHAAALDAWLERCRLHGWRPAMIGASDAARVLARAVGLRGIHIGDEAQVPVASFRLDRPAMRNVRQAVQRTRNAHVTVTVERAGTLDGRTRDELAAVVDEWRHGHDEIGFAMTMDRLVDLTYPDAVVVIARRDDRVVGFQRYFLARGGASLSLDVMPRLRHAPNGVNERLIAEAITWGEGRGVEGVSLNFAAFRTLFESEESLPRRFLRWGVHRLDPFINVESLYRFNAKFRPEWVARHVLYRSALDLPAVLVASLRVEFGQPTSRALEAASQPVTGRPVGPVLT